MSNKPIKGTGWYMLPAGTSVFDDVDFDVELEKVLKELDKHAPKCECGAEKVHGEGTPHSDWCPKFNKE